MEYSKKDLILKDSSKLFHRSTLLFSAIGILVMAVTIILVVRGSSAAGASTDAAVIVGAE
jgi:hypothetical protein